MHKFILVFSNVTGEPTLVECYITAKFPKFPLSIDINWIVFFPKVHQCSLQTPNSVKSHITLRLLLLFNRLWTSTLCLKSRKTSVPLVFCSVMFISKTFALFQSEKKVPLQQAKKKNQIEVPWKKEYFCHSKTFNFAINALRNPNATKSP